MSQSDTRLYTYDVRLRITARRFRTVRVRATSASLARKIKSEHRASPATVAA